MSSDKGPDELSRLARLTAQVIGESRNSTPLTHYLPELPKIQTTPQQEKELQNFVEKHRYRSKTDYKGLGKLPERLGLPTEFVFKKVYQMLDAMRSQRASTDLQKFIQEQLNPNTIPQNVLNAVDPNNNSNQKSKSKKTSKFDPLILIFTTPEQEAAMRNFAMFRRRLDTKPVLSLSKDLGLPFEFVLLWLENYMKKKEIPFQ